MFSSNIARYIIIALPTVGCKSLFTKKTALAQSRRLTFHNSIISSVSGITNRTLKITAGTAL